MTDSWGASTKRALWHDYSTPGWYHLTFHTYKHHELFSGLLSDSTEAQQHTEILQRVLVTVSEHYPCARIDTSRIQPSQLDLLIELMTHRNQVEEPCQEYASWRYFRRTMTISLISGFVKMNSGYQINLLHKTNGQAVWQERYSDRFLKDEESVNEVRAMLREGSGGSCADTAGPHEYSAIEGEFETRKNVKGRSDDAEISAPATSSGALHAATNQGEKEAAYNYGSNAEAVVVRAVSKRSADNDSNRKSTADVRIPLDGCGLWDHTIGRRLIARETWCWSIAAASEWDVSAWPGGSCWVKVSFDKGSG